VDGVSYEVAVQDARSLAARRGASQHDTSTQKLTAAMPGKVMRMLAREGDEVVAGQGIVVIEAMKMQNEVRTPKNGILKKLLVQAGTNVNAGDVLAVVE
jgi:biotin carboxyl carrier protein